MGLGSMMRAVLPCVEGKLVLGALPRSPLSPKEVLLHVKACGVNRLDLLQRRGRYPVPCGESEVLGVEASGVVCESQSSLWEPGQEVVALLQGGGYAEYVAVPETLVMPKPPNLSHVEAAAIPENWVTGFQLLFRIANLKPGDTVLVHAGASGVGLAALQLCQGVASCVIATSSSPDKLEKCKQLGADHVILVPRGATPTFDAAVRRITQGRGVDVVLDCVGGSYFHSNMRSCAVDARWVLYGLLGGAVPHEGAVSLGTFLAKRISLLSTTLRSRDAKYRPDLLAQFGSLVLPRFVSGALQVVVAKEFPLAQVAAAHDYMAADANIGKIILTVEEHAAA